MSRTGVAAAGAACLLTLVAAGCGGHRVSEKHLVFVRATAPQNAVVFIDDPDGRHERRLARGLSAVVSPDGRTVAVGRVDGIHLVSSDGKRDRRLTSAVHNPQAWSPDGKRLVAGVDRLSLVDVASGRVRDLARGGFYGFSCQRCKACTDAGHAQPRGAAFAESMFPSVEIWAHGGVRGDRRRPRPPRGRSRW